MPRRYSAPERGQVYDLRRLFRRLNGLYFGGKVRARVLWGRSRSQRAQRSREFGAYYYDQRLIRIHPVLDQSWVPVYVVESVLHHEMCHQLCPEKESGGRRLAHTAEFRRLERTYAFHHEAQGWLDQNLRRLLRPQPSCSAKSGSTKRVRQLRLL